MTMRFASRGTSFLCVMLNCMAEPCSGAPGLAWSVLSLSFFFFSSRRRHTRSLRDWSSDVCSSDLLPGHPNHLVVLVTDHLVGLDELSVLLLQLQQLLDRFLEIGWVKDDIAKPEDEIGRASCRERV